MIDEIIYPFADDISSVNVHYFLEILQSFTRQGAPALHFGDTNFNNFAFLQQELGFAFPTPLRRRNPGRTLLIDQLGEALGRVRKLGRQ